MLRHCSMRLVPSRDVLFSLDEVPMRFTVGRRIALALTIELVLLVVVAVVARVRSGETRHLRERARPATFHGGACPRVESEIRAADVEQLRFLRHRRRALCASPRQSCCARARHRHGGRRLGQDPGGAREWTRTEAMMAQWNDGMVAAATAVRAKDVAGRAPHSG